MTETMDNALALMAVGMGFVFSFLIILVAVTLIMSAIAMRLSPAEEKVVPGAQDGQQEGTGSPMEDKQLMAVISAAVSKYRARHRK